MTDEMSRVFRLLSETSAKYLKKRLVMTSSDRTCDKQLRISGATSYHLVGQAFDFQVQPYSEADQQWLGEVAEHFGYRWGGRFKPYDPVHIDNGNRTRPGRCIT
jgi:uncharacterized protein YcbK (DUF882 family)